MLRILKIQDVGDYYRKKSVPKLTLQGKWLEKAGFSANSHVVVTQDFKGQLVITIKMA